jgi:hypothetical protein
MLHLWSQPISLTDIMVERGETTAWMKTTLNLFLSKSDKHYPIWNIDKLFTIEKNNENVLTIRKTKKTAPPPPKKTITPRKNFSRVKSDAICQYRSVHSPVAMARYNLESQRQGQLVAMCPSSNCPSAQNQVYDVTELRFFLQGEVSWTGH